MSFELGPLSTNVNPSLENINLAVESGSRNKAAPNSSGSLAKELGFMVIHSISEAQISLDRSRVDLKNSIIPLNPKAINSEVLNTIKDLDKGIMDTIPTKDEHAIVKDLLALFQKQPDLLRQVLKGGHVRIDDAGDYYNSWRGLQSARARISSHPNIPGTKQYGVMGPWVHEILFGVVEDEGKTKTFFQLENTPWAEGFGNRMGHTADSIQYFVSRKNVGPYGSSVHTDKNPIHISVPNSSHGKTQLA